LNISIAIPDSSLKDETTKLDKSRKASAIARSCAIFGVKTIFIYSEKGGSDPDRFLLATILKYLETPQYLRRTLFPKIDDLKYAGIMHPLQIPHHSLSANPDDLKTGDIREAAVVHYKGKKFVDIGIRQLIPYYGKEREKKRITVQIKSTSPISVKEISEPQVTAYWGYKVKERPNITNVIEEWDGNIILTSRKGKEITPSQLHEYIASNKQLLLVFGAPDRGLYDILGKKINQIQNAKVFNFFPDQKTETVRLEEAMLGIMAILNFESPK
jgi:methyltransferase